MNYSPEIEEIIAKNALTYDLLPYESKPFPQSQPARLAAIAHIFGVKAKALPSARVLELGCAAGGNIIPLAVQYPEAKFIGVDLSRKQVAAGRARIAKLGLKNIELQCKSFTELDNAVGKFDYIICHGVFSWVERILQAAILEIIRDRLAPEGIAYISYNVLPGWRMMQPVRDAVLNQIPPSYDSANRVAASLELLDFLAKASPQGAIYGNALRQMAERLAQFPSDYFAHEFLEECNEPCTFTDFAARANDNGLAYLGDSDLQTMMVGNLGAEVATEILRRANNSIVQTEQMMDLVNGRTFRCSLLVHAAVGVTLNRNLQPACLDGLHMLSAALMEIKTVDGVSTLVVGGKHTYSVSGAATIAALEKFIARYPSSSTIAELASKDTDREEIKASFFNLMSRGIVLPMSERVKMASAPTKQPKASKLALKDAESGATYTTNARHETVQLDVAARFILQNMKGQKSQSELVAGLVAEAKAGRMIFNEGGKPAETLEANAIIAEKHAGVTIGNLARAAVLEG